MEYKTSSVEETKKLSATILDEALNQKRKGALVLALMGELGAGKTTFVQGIAKNLGIRRNITSPTFVLMKKYKLKNQPFSLMYHLDCYRVQSSAEILDLDWQEIIFDPKNIVLVEWAEKISDILPTGTLRINFKNLGKEQRALQIGDLVD